MGGIVPSPAIRTRTVKVNNLKALSVQSMTTRSAAPALLAGRSVRLWVPIVVVLRKEHSRKGSFL